MTPPLPLLPHLARFVHRGAPRSLPSLTTTRWVKNLDDSTLTRSGFATASRFSTKFKTSLLLSTYRSFSDYRTGGGGYGGGAYGSPPSYYQQQQQQQQQPQSQQQYQGSSGFRGDGRGSYPDGRYPRYQIVTQTTDQLKQSASVLRRDNYDPNAAAASNPGNLLAHGQYKIALLVDAENIDFSNINGVVNEVQKLGVLTIRRIYADWTNEFMRSWRPVVLANAMVPVHMFQNSVGKGSTDSALIIDAMEMLYTKDIDVFCIVSSDADFTRLCTKLRENGKLVLGIGGNLTPAPFIVSCNRFVYLSSLDHGDGLSPAPSSASTSSAPTHYAAQPPTSSPPSTSSSAASGSQSVVTTPSGPSQQQPQKSSSSSSASSSPSSNQQQQTVSSQKEKEKDKEQSTKEKEKESKEKEAAAPSSAKKQKEKQTVAATTPTPPVSTKQQHEPKDKETSSNAATVAPSTTATASSSKSSSSKDKDKEKKEEKSASSSPSTPLTAPVPSIVSPSETPSANTALGANPLQAQNERLKTVALPLLTRAWASHRTDAGWASLASLENEIKEIDPNFSVSSFSKEAKTVGDLIRIAFPTQFELSTEDALPVVRRTNGGGGGKQKDG